MRTLASVVTYDTGVNLQCTKPVWAPSRCPECPAAHGELAALRCSFAALLVLRYSNPGR